MLHRLTRVRLMSHVLMGSFDLGRVLIVEHHDVRGEDYHSTTGPPLEAERGKQ